MPSQSLIIGDIQGCYKGLKQLLKKAKFNPDTDRLFAVGDLVARGEDSLSTLQYLSDLGDAFTCVLGNHDLHLLAIACGLRQPKSSDRLDALLKHAERDRLITWLRHFPLARQITPTLTMVHAGLYPGWSTQTLLRCSAEVEAQLRSDGWADMLTTMYGNEPSHWDDTLEGTDRLRFIINACTRMRFITGDNGLEFTNKNSPASAPTGLTPWFNVPNPQLNEDEAIVFGHWAALEGNTSNARFIALDTGYVWGNRMTALRIEDNARIQITA
ncbi:symmetrical bis(5'-nucleosyl)-tetraphosphatase [Alteromonas sp. CYL-A6]|uniref:symmetrical bis(5'-nucleosyl)-tetraphosphatase n=1 Tax=Alteromonas nitratireducens TaxID=3390813 RepID=UPI0034B56237